jgi:hypothetical protein
MVVWTTPNYDWRYLIVRLSTPKRPATLHKLWVFPFPNQPIFQDVKEQFLLLLSQLFYKYTNYFLLHQAFNVKFVLNKKARILWFGLSFLDLYFLLDTHPPNRPIGIYTLIGYKPILW